jgi:hypothetical protein
VFSIENREKIKIMKKNRKERKHVYDGKIEFIYLFTFFLKKLTL